MDIIAFVPHAKAIALLQDTEPIQGCILPRSVGNKIPFASLGRWMEVKSDICGLIEEEVIDEYLIPVPDIKDLLALQTNLGGEQRLAHQKE